ncbi:hypothetical protein LAZ67_1001028 [Cordylochernes scorpioides]|uniref:Uncharacterized protein n=1 Tax=Cordylochernes scorpioides TaxID=51811 RepID=A0ABY6JVF7_9ARAC|nr:hypothetical protein LAZ67_1001028 [Cordylochernes scorpioides]
MLRDCSVVVTTRPAMRCEIDQPIQLVARENVEQCPGTSSTFNRCLSRDDKAKFVVPISPLPQVLRLAQSKYEGRPSTSTTDDNIEKIGKLIHEDRRLSIRVLAERTGMGKESVRQILHEKFNMHKVCAKLVPKLESRKKICADILTNIDNDPGLLDKVKSALKETLFESVEAVIAKATEVLNQLTDFQHCFQKRKSRMERCRDHQRDYIEVCCNW